MITASAIALTLHRIDPSGTSRSSITPVFAACPEQGGMDFALKHSAHSVNRGLAGLSFDPRRGEYGAGPACGDFENAEDPGAERYAVKEAVFSEILSAVPSSRCVTIRELTGKRTGEWICLTFDDGYRSDFCIAFPGLLERGMKATFFVTAENVGRPGYAGFPELRTMNSEGMEIGSHGLSHHYLVGMGRGEAVREIRESKDRIEQGLGASVTSFAPVGGHFKNWMLETATDAGYTAFATMIPGTTRPVVDKLVLRRNHVQAQHDLAHVRRIFTGDSLLLRWNRFRYYLLLALKLFLGLHRYDHLKQHVGKV